MKRCPRCELDLPDLKFYSNKARESKLSSWCKECTRKYMNNRNERIRKGLALEYIRSPSRHRRVVINGKLTCSRCGVEKSTESFSKANSYCGHEAQCKSCKKEIYDERYRDIVNNRKLERRKEKVRHSRLYKEYVGCQYCGEKRWQVLDFHHVETKSFSIASAPNKNVSMQRYEDEINKCIVICSNCHRFEHYLQ